MNDDTIADLKQFIAATVSQEVARVNSRMDKLEQNLNNKIDDLGAGIGDAIEELTAHVETRLDNHETRISKLETQTTSS
jgi:hypothetical protein